MQCIAAVSSLFSIKQVCLCVHFYFGSIGRWSQNVVGLQWGDIWNPSTRAGIFLLLFLFFTCCCVFFVVVVLHIIRKVACIKEWLNERKNERMRERERRHLCKWSIACHCPILYTHHHHRYRYRNEIRVYTHHCISSTLLRPACSLLS